MAVFRRNRRSTDQIASVSCRLDPLIALAVRRESARGSLCHKIFPFGRCGALIRRSTKFTASGANALPSRRRSSSDEPQARRDAELALWPSVRRTACTSRPRADGHGGAAGTAVLAPRRVDRSENGIGDTRGARAIDGGEEIADDLATELLVSWASGGNRSSSPCRTRSINSASQAAPRLTRLAASRRKVGVLNHSMLSGSTPSIVASIAVEQF